MMKISVLRLIEDILIGGRNGEMAFIENNPLIAQLYREFCHKNSAKKGITFKDFLEDCLKEDSAEEVKEDDIAEILRPKEVYKTVSIDTKSKEFLEYESLVKEQKDIDNKVNASLKVLAEKTSPLYFGLGSYSISNNGYFDDFRIKYSININNY